MRSQRRRSARPAERRAVSLIVLPGAALLALGLPATAAPAVAGTPTPAELSAAPAGRTPVATMEYAATEAVDARGDSASVWTARVSGKWQVVNIATGSDETDCAAPAGAARWSSGNPR